MKNESFKKKLNTQEMGGKGFNIEGKVKSSVELRRLFKIKCEKIEASIEGTKASREDGPNNKKLKHPSVAITITKTKEFEQGKAKELENFQLNGTQNKGGGKISTKNNQCQKEMLGNSNVLLHHTQSQGVEKNPSTNNQGQKEVPIQGANISSKGSQIQYLKKQPMKKVILESDEYNAMNQCTRQPIKRTMAERVVLEHSASIESPLKKNKIMPKCRSLLISDFLEQNGEDNIEDEEHVNKDEVFKIMDEQEEPEQEDNGEQEEQEQEDNEEGTYKKRTRGPTRCLQIHARNIEEREEIMLDEDGEPIGPNDKVVSNLSHFLGTVARNGNFCPLIYTSFKALTKEERERIWDYVNEKYIIPKYIIPDIGKKAIFARINDAWRHYKNYVKRRYFLNYPSLKERLKNRPKYIPENHFRALMTYWTNEEVQDVSQQNAMNRAKQKYINRMGPTNFAIICAKLRAKKENGEDVSQAEMFVETRQIRKGKEVDQETQNDITKLQDSLKSSSETAGEAFQLIFGKEKPGRVRCMGRVVTPTILKKNDEIAALKKQHTEEMSSMSRQLKGMEALLRCLMKQNNPELDDEALDNMMSNAMTPRSSESTFLPNHNEHHCLSATSLSS